MQRQTKCNNNKIIISRARASSMSELTLRRLSFPETLDSLTKSSPTLSLVKCHSQAPDVACRMFWLPLCAYCIVHACLRDSIRKGYNCMKISGNKLLKSPINSVNFVWELLNININIRQTASRSLGEEHVSACRCEKRKSESETSLWKLYRARSALRYQRSKCKRSSWMDHNSPREPGDDLHLRFWLEEILKSNLFRRSSLIMLSVLVNW